MTKQEIIKKEWGFHYAEDIDENGWRESNIGSLGWDNKYFDVIKKGENIYKIRPKSLNGISTNNGWNKIESTNDYPETYTRGYVVKDGRIFEMCEHRSMNVWWCYKWKRLIENPSHYRRSEEIKLPLH